MVEGQVVRVVRPGYLRERNIRTPAGFILAVGETGVFVLVEDRLIGYIALADQVRPESAEAIRTLHANGIKCMLLTGDNEQVAAQVSTELDVDGYFAQVLPYEKLEKIKELQLKGEFVAMTGDGVNDAPALAKARCRSFVGINENSYI